MSIRKKILLVISVILLIGFVLVYLFSSLYTHVNITKDLYNDVSYTFESVFQNFAKSFSKFKTAKSSSYTLNIYLNNASKLPFSAISLSNNSSDKYYEISFRDFKLRGSSAVDISTFAANETVGFYLDTNPDVYYTASGNKFRSKWNSSMYAKLIKMPDFVPENVNYNKVNSLISPENFCKLFLGMGLGKDKINVKEIINNINISSPKSYALYQNGKKHDAQIVRLSVSKHYIESLVQKFKKSSEKASFDYLNSFLKDAENFLINSPEKTLKIDFVILNNILLWAETSVKLSSGLVNARLDISDNEINFEIKHLSSQNSAKSDYALKLTTGSTPDIKLVFSKGKKEVFKLKLKKQDDYTVVSDLLYYDKHSAPHTVSAVYSPSSQKIQDDIPSKNIYSLSVLDVFKLYKKIDDTGNNLL